MVDWATVPKQTLLKEDGQVGDCWRCCIAAVLGIPAQDVPHFVRDHAQSVDEDTQAWLNERSYGIAYAPRLYVYHRWDLPVPAVPIIKCGPTCRSREMGQTHAVVYVGNALVYDPHPSGAGLTAVTEEWLVFPLRK